MAEVDSAAAYADAVSSLQDKSSPIYQFVRVYGIGVEGEPMTVNSLFGSGTLTMPVINATRIDKCVHGRMNQTVLTGSTFDDNFACTDWETIAPASAVAASAAI